MAVPNPHRGDVQFVAGGQTYTLRFNHAALAAAETRLNRSVFQVVREWGDEIPRVSVIAALLWAGLQIHHAGFTVEAAYELMDADDYSFGQATQTVDEALRKAWSPPESSTRSAATRPMTNGADSTGTASLSPSSVTDTASTSFGT